MQSPVSALVNGKRDQEAEGELAENRGVSVRLGPVGGFQVPKDHNARFGPDWVTKVITFDGRENSHGGNDGAPKE